MSAENLWPSDIVQDAMPDSPREILKTQADALAPATNDMLHGLVEPSAYRGRLALDFVVVAPALDDYEYRLFKLWPNEGPDPYPARLIVSSKESRTVGSADALRDELRRIFSADSTRRVISDLIAYSRERRAEETDESE